MITQLSIRIKIAEKRESKFHFAIYSLNIKNRNTATFKRDIFKPNEWTNLYDFDINKIDNNFLHSADYKYICDTDPISLVCKKNFLKIMKFKKTDGSFLTPEDEIFNNYYLEGEINFNNEILTIKFQSIKHEIFRTREFDNIGNIYCYNICKHQKSCDYIDIVGIKNSECNCGEYLYGVNCEHKYTCSNCENDKCKKGNICSLCKKGWIGEKCNIPVCTSLKMCGINGNCSINIKKRKCDCHSNWNGKYCTNKKLDR